MLVLLCLAAVCPDTMEQIAMHGSLEYKANHLLISPLWELSKHCIVCIADVLPAPKRSKPLVLEA